MTGRTSEGDVHMTRNAVVLTLAILMLASPAAAGNDRAGTSAANFLAVGTGPAVLGMGGAALGRAGSLDLATWNPGALGFVDEMSLELAHANLDEQTMQEWAGMGGRFGSSHTHWAMSALYQSEGTFEARDASNNSIGTFTTGAAAGMLQLAQSFGPHVALGVGGKFVLDELGPAARGTGMTFDGGMSLRFGGVGFGFAAQNMFGQMKYGSATYPFPSNYGAGVSFAHAASGITAAADVNVPSTSYTNVRGGLEWSWKQTVALRAGYRSEMGAPADEPLSGPTFGTGIGTHGLWFDYGLLLNGNAGGQHRLAISLRPGQMGWKAGDPFGQRQIPREFDQSTLVGPPAPAPSNGKKSKR